MADKFDVAAITSIATMDRFGNIRIPYEIICEMFGSMAKAAGTDFRIHWNRENNAIVLKKIGKATNYDF